MSQFYTLPFLPITPSDQQGWTKMAYNASGGLHAPMRPQLVPRAHLNPRPFSAMVPLKVVQGGATAMRVLQSGGAAAQEGSPGDCGVFDASCIQQLPAMSYEPVKPKSQPSTQKLPDARIMQADDKAARSRPRSRSSSKPRSSYLLPEKDVNPRYKTQLCRQFVERGACHFGDACLFAHSCEELQQQASTQNHPNHRLAEEPLRCIEFHNLGVCSVGATCEFVHDTHDTSEVSAPPAAAKAAADTQGSSLPKVWQLRTPDKLPEAKGNSTPRRFKEGDTAIIRSPPISPADCFSLFDSPCPTLKPELPLSRKKPTPSSKWHSEKQRVTFSPPCLMMKLPKIVEL